MGQHLSPLRRLLPTSSASHGAWALPHGWGQARDRRNLDSGGWGNYNLASWSLRLVLSYTEPVSACDAEESHLRVCTSIPHSEEGRQNMPKQLGVLIGLCSVWC